MGDERAKEGNLVASRYHLLSRLGKGASGTVWRCFDHQLEIDVALKLLEVSGSQDAIRARFATEADLSTRMRSPHIVRVLDRGIAHDGTPYIAFELLVGEALSERLEREGALPLADCAAVVVQTCRALARAHSVGVVHRDIKPENVFLCEQVDRALVKVLDFGIARGTLGRAWEGPLHPTPELTGTFEYMSPEILIDGKPPDPRQDLYALGVVAYRAFTGVLPFAGDTLGKVLLALSQTTPPAPSALRATKKDLADALDAWFEKAIARDPDQRFQTASAMAEAFVQAYRPTGTSSRMSMTPPSAMDPEAPISIKVPRLPSINPDGTKKD